MEKNDNFTCDVCKKGRFAFISIETEKRGIFGTRYNVCVSCFKDKDIEKVIEELMQQEMKDQVKHHQDKIDELNKRFALSEKNDGK